ncbi:MULTISPECIES: hypothetical protein [Planktothricoides]|uniref:Uncharacterized protein n=1 Tax=Planktothricoides raciborskii GIHE-MW2 TaxID=2792601 RepID=A0AAU8JLY9_9CYAN|nr:MULTISPECIES: hypothetical protein [Planktothricoides]
MENCQAIAHQYSEPTSFDAKNPSADLRETWKTFNQFSQFFS